MKIFRIITYFILLFACLTFGLIGFINRSKTVVENTTEINIMCIKNEVEKNEVEEEIYNKQSKVLLILKNKAIINNIYNEETTYLNEETYTLAKEEILEEDIKNYTFLDETYTIKKISTFDKSTFKNLEINKIKIQDKLVSLGYKCN